MKSYGTVTYQSSPGARLGYFHINCDPHVAMVLRRLFDGAKRGRNNAVVVSGTDSNCHTLEWVLIKYPMEVDTPVLKRGADRQRQRMEMVDEARSPDYVPPTFDLAVPLRDYQRVAADLAIRSKGLLLGDDVGLGKTASCIATFVVPDTLPAIVVTLTHLTSQWDNEIRRFAPALRTHVIQRAQAYPLVDGYGWEVVKGKRRIVKSGIKKLPDVVILSYSKLVGWADMLISINPGMIVFDECQELRTGASEGVGAQGSKKNDAAKAIAFRSRYRCGASATPIFNLGGEVWNVMDVLSPGLLGDKSEFYSEWCSPQGNGKYLVTDINALRVYLTEEGAMLRRRRKDVGRELPPMMRNWQTVELNRKGLDSISVAVAELARAVLREDIAPFAKMQAAGELDRQLRQATGVAKIPSVLAFIQMLIFGSDEPKYESVVVFAHHHLVFDGLMDGLAKAGIKAVKFTGKQSQKEKAAALDAFVNGDAQVFLLSNRAGVGIDGLQSVCSTGVVAELDWSPGVHLQNEGRLNRDGQEDNVAFYYCVSDEGSDPVVRDVLGIKDQQRHGLVDGDLGDTSDEPPVDLNRMRKMAQAYLDKYKAP